MKIKWWMIACICLFCFLGASVLIYSAASLPPPNNSNVFSEVVKTAFLCLGGIGVLIPITLNILNSIEQRRFDRIENTFNLLTRWDDTNLLTARNYTRKIKKNRENISAQELVRQIESDPDLEQSVILVTNYLDQVRFSMKNNRIDRDEFRTSLGGALTSIIDRFWPYYQKLPPEICKDLDDLKGILKKS